MKKILNELSGAYFMLAFIFFISTVSLYPENKFYFSVIGFVFSIYFAISGYGVFRQARELIKKS